MWKKIGKYALLFNIGGSIYILIEMLWRAIMSSMPTHWTMFIVGGLVFLIVGELNEHLEWSSPLLIQGAVGTLCVLIIEFISGCILNIYLGLAIWDYSDKPLNILGQVCPQFAVAWFILVLIAIITDDHLRYILFDEEKPTYKII